MAYAPPPGDPAPGRRVRRRPGRNARAGGARAGNAGAGNARAGGARAGGARDGAGRRRGRDDRGRAGRGRGGRGSAGGPRRRRGRVPEGGVPGPGPAGGLVPAGGCAGGGAGPAWGQAGVLGGAGRAGAVRAGGRRGRAGRGGGRRAGRCAPGPAGEAVTMAARTTVVSFRSGGQDWAVALERVQRVLGARGVLPLPDPRPGVAGLLHRDGRTVTVVSPLGGGQAGQVLVLDDGASSIGLLVDEVVGIERVQEEPGAPPAGQRSPLVAGVLPGARPLLLLDVGALTGWLAR